MLRLTALLVLCLGPIEAAHAQFAYSGASPVAERFRLAAHGWQGTTYQFGGASLNGIDCSALMVEWFDHLFGVQLPRTSRQQFASGQPIDRDRLTGGDLVFFGSPSRISHVGVYVGNGEFAHASESRGVTVSPMSGAYWRSRYQGARRVLTDPMRSAPFAPTLPLAATPATFSAPSVSLAAPQPAAVAEPVRGLIRTFSTDRPRSKPATSRRIGW
jgi:hypothetical protein